MEINGLPLPKRFIECIASGELVRSVGSWQLQSIDAYGNQLECSLGEVYATVGELSAATSQLSSHFVVDGSYGSESDWADQPGYVPDIVEFSKIICFGDSGDGAPFCFDYRDGENPGVLWWDDVYWRRIAPDFISFLGLIER